MAAHRFNRPVLLLIAATSVLVLAVMATRDTGAYWHEQEPVSGATVSSGTLLLTVDDAESVDLGSAFSNSAMGPGAIEQKSVNIKNAGTTPLVFRLSAATEIPSQGSPPGGLIPTARLMAVGSAASDCDSIKTDPPGSSGLPIGGTLHALAPNATARVCLRVQVSTAPTSGASYTASFTFAAQQT